MAFQVLPRGKAKMIEGERRHTRFAVGPCLVKFTLSENNRDFHIHVRRPDHDVEWVSPTLLPGVESARIAHEVSERQWLENVRREHHCLMQIAVLNYETTTATSDLIWEALPGIGAKFRARILEKLRDNGYIKKKGSKLKLTVNGEDRLVELQLIVDANTRRIIEPEDEAPEDKPKKKRKKKEAS